VIGVVEPWLEKLLSQDYGLHRPRLLGRFTTSPGRVVWHLQVVTVDALKDVAVKVAMSGQDRSRVSGQVQAWVADHEPGLAAGVWATRAGALSTVADGRRITVTEWVAGDAPDASGAQWSAVGSALARLHSLPVCAQPFAVPVGAAADELSVQAPGYTFGSDFAALIPRTRAIPLEPSVVVHGEVNAANVIVGQGGRVSLLDWDQAGAGSAVLDLGHPLICVFITEEVAWDPDQLGAFYAAYRKGVSFAVPTAADVFNAALWHAMRYLQFGNHDARWARIRWAVGHEDLILATVHDALHAKPKE